VGQVDALVITALPLEFEAAKSAAGNNVRWHERDQSGPAPYVSGEIATPSGGRLSIALARPPAMSGRSTGPIVTALTRSLTPTCLAMCGVCAGNPSSTAPGDVLVGTPVFQYDEGKQRGAEFLGDVQQFPLEDRWLRAAQDFDPGCLPSFGPATEDEAIVWLLERLLLDQEPRNHPARERYFPPRTWAERLARAEADGLITRRSNGEVALTDVGRARIELIRYNDVDGPQRLPFAVLTGPMASGNAVMQDLIVWDRLRRMGTRRILGLEMETATVATVAHQFDVPHWLVVKGVMDGAELDRDDRFKRFAASASAEVLFALLAGLLEPDDRSPGPDEPAGSGGAVAVPGEVKLEFAHRMVYDWLDLADYVGMPGFVRAGFGPGEGPRGVWEWLETRGRLGDLPGALTNIGRADLAELLDPHLR
jgi:nucleoside phosphorylase